MKSNFSTRTAPNWIRLDSGIEVHIASLNQYLTYRCQLTTDGSLTTSIPDAVEELRSEFRRHWNAPDNIAIPFHVIEPARVRHSWVAEDGERLDGIRLPRVACIAELVNPQAVHPKGGEWWMEAFQYSMLVVGWFQDAFALPIDPSSLKRMQALDWATLARDFSD